MVKSILHNLGVVIVGFALAYLATKLDSLLGMTRIDYIYTEIFGVLLLAVGFLLRVWATFHFYQNQMKVISLETQNTLVTDGPFRFSRNPLYLGGNVFVFLGAGLVLGSPTMIFFTIAHLPIMNWMVGREERQLEASFGEEWLRYRRRVPRWL